MKVIGIKDIEDCFDGSFIKEIRFDVSISLKFVKYLAQGNEFEYYSDFPKPFFKMDIEDKYQLKGAIGNNSMRVIFYKHNIKKNQDLLVNMVNCYE